MTKNQETKTIATVSVFLGGTCSESTWRDELMTLLSDKVDAFNPVVDDWDESAQTNEDYHKANDDYCLFVITPEMSGIYSIFELADYSNKRPDRTICCFLKAYGDKEFDDSIWRGFKKMKLDLIHNGAIVCDDLAGVADFLNSATS